MLTSGTLFLLLIQFEVRTVRTFKVSFKLKLVKWRFKIKLSITLYIVT